MEPQGAKIEDSGGVRFEQVKIGSGSTVVTVSTIKREVYGKDIEVGDHVTWHCGQMSEQALQGLPKAHNLPTKATSVRDQRTEDIESKRYIGAGQVLGEAASTGASAKRPTW